MPVASAAPWRPTGGNPRGANLSAMPVRLPADVLDQFQRFTLHNSPYPAHAEGAAVDLYTSEAIRAHPGGGTRAPSPVAGEVVDTRTVAAPARDYAADDDHLILVDVERPASAAGLVARVLHVDPTVAPGDRVAIGEDLGRLVRSGFYAPWVPDHLHLGFRGPDSDPYRASGSVPLDLGVAVEPVHWDGTGEVVATGDTYAVLDSPAHPAPGERWVGVAVRGPAGTGVLDGGFPHYDGGGLLADDARDASGVTTDGPVSLAGQRVGHVAGRAVAWDDVTVLANGRPVRGLSLFCGRDADFGAKLVGDDVDLAVGEAVEVTLASGGDAAPASGSDE